MPSETLSLAELRRLDEIVDDWAMFFCKRVAPDGFESQFGDAVDSGRQWRPTHEIVEALANGIGEQVDLCVDELEPPHTRNLHLYARLHFLRQTSEMAVWTMQRLADEDVEAAKLALVPGLKRKGLF